MRETAARRERRRRVPGAANRPASEPYTAGDMIVLGITETHCATAAVLADGRIIGCASEERWSRIKNDAG